MKEEIIRLITSYYHCVSYGVYSDHIIFCFDSAINEEDLNDMLDYEGINYIMTAYFKDMFTVWFKE